MKSNRFLKSVLFIAFNLILTDQSFSRNKTTLDLQKKKLLKIPVAQCEEIESKLGQLLYVNVDGNGAGDKSIHPAYYDMVNDLQIGAVIPHSNNSSQNTQFNALKKLKTLTDLPLMIGVDYFGAQSEKSGARFGLGYGSGILSDIGHSPDSCFEQKAFVTAFLHKATGLNQALGPTIERNENHKFLSQEASKVQPRADQLIQMHNQMGVHTVVKHFPYTPTSFNLHQKNEDIKYSPEKVDDLVAIFRKMAQGSCCVMTTHLYNSNIDPNDMATFSKIWVDKLRKDMGFNGLIISDGLFMIQHQGSASKKMATR